MTTLVYIKKNIYTQFENQQFLMRSKNTKNAASHRFSSVVNVTSFERR